jgi:hypothetical protein
VTCDPHIQASWDPIQANFQASRMQCIHVSSNPITRCKATPGENPSLACSH